ncbi:MAG: hypothetical protein FWC27_15850 [Firmicutes bacterium]|nr:hypothetical protein [Bacillota bacterium]
MLNHEIKAAEKPIIKFETRKYSMSLSPETVLCVGQPRHVVFYYDRERQVLIMEGTDVATRYSTKLPPLSKTDRFKPSQMYMPGVVRIFADQLGWEINKCYEIEGIYYSESRIATFELSGAKESGGWENAL